MRVAVIGAGLSGLAAAERLRADGHGVVVWEKSRGVGGRTATRRADDWRFDHGAPFLHDGAQPLASLQGVGRARLQDPSGVLVEATVGTPTANAPAKQLAEGVDIRTGVRVAALTQEGAGWALVDDAGVPLGSFDAVIVAVPAPQAAALLADAAPCLAARAGTIAFALCWSVMAAWDAPLELPFTIAPEFSGLAMAVAEAAKPGRAAGERWVLQADAALSADLLERPAADVVALLLAGFAVLTGRRLPEPAYATAHRWLYARPLEALGEPFLVDGTLSVVGDWCLGSTAGAALRSGSAAGAALSALAV